MNPSWINDQIASACCLGAGSRGTHGKTVPHGTDDEPCPWAAIVPSGQSVRSRCARTVARPRESQLATVPTGASRMRAISACV